MAKNAVAAKAVADPDAPKTSAAKKTSASPAAKKEASKASKSQTAKAVVSKTADAKTAASKSAAPKTTTTKSAAAKSATEKKAPALLTLTDIGDHLASTFDMPKSHAKIYLAEAVTMIGKSLRKGNKVRISGLGVFQVKKRAARKGRNPASGEAIKIKATKRVGFAVARDLKAKL